MAVWAAVTIPIGAVQAGTSEPIGCPRGAATSRREPGDRWSASEMPGCGHRWRCAPTRLSGGVFCRPLIPDLLFRSASSISPPLAR